MKARPLKTISHHMHVHLSVLSSQFTVNYSTWSRWHPWGAFDTSIPWTENSIFVSFHVHAEDGLSHWLLITVTSRRSRRRDCQADFVQVDGLQSGTPLPQSKGETLAAAREIIPSEVVSNSKMMKHVFDFPSPLCSVMCSFIYGREWPLPHRGPVTSA